MSHSFPPGSLDELRTERLLLRRPRESDRAELHVMYADTEVMETLGGVKRVVPADGGRGHLSLVTLPSFRSGLAAVLEITAQNRGESAWPGLDWQSEGIVRVRYAFSDDSGGVVASGTDPLYRDIPPGSRANLRVVLRPPDHPGRYELRVDLVQEFASREEITSLDVEPMRLGVDVN